jgi:alcohol dehydrogenase
VRPQLERAAAAVGCDDAIAWVDTLREQLGVPCRLRDIGVRRETLERIASKTMGERGLYFNPRPVQDAAEILGLLEQAF